MASLRGWIVSGDLYRGMSIANPTSISTRGYSLGPKSGIQAEPSALHAERFSYDTLKDALRIKLSSDGFESLKVLHKVSVYFPLHAKGLNLLLHRLDRAL